MTVGFSYVGIIWLVLLFVPNILWIKRKPRGCESLPPEDRILGILERIGEVGVTMISLLNKDLNPRPGIRLVWLTASFACMVLYELWWVKYFRSERRLEDFYSAILGIPLAGAVLPVAAFALLAIYGKSPHLGLFVIPLAIGHIGIHRRHMIEAREIKKKESEE